MRTILTLDVGNNNPHVAIFKEGAMQALSPLEEFFQRAGHQNLGEDVWIAASTVGRQSREVEGFLEENKERVLPLMSWREEDCYRDMPVNYADTLGEDRLFQAYYLFKGRGNLLSRYTLALVDAGSFTTIDFIGQDGHLGGFILPGNQTYLDSFQRGARLPHLPARDAELQQELNLGLPATTETAILMGLNLIMRGAYTFIDHNLAEGPTAFLVTGGHGQSHWKAIRKLDSSNNLLLPYNANLIHDALHFVAQEFITESENG